MTDTKVYCWIYFDHERQAEAKTPFKCTPAAALSSYGIDLIDPVPDTEEPEAIWLVLVRKPTRQQERATM